MAIPSEEKNRLKKGCLWIGGVAAGGFILLGVISAIINPDAESRRAAIEAERAGLNDDEPTVDLDRRGSILESTYPQTPIAALHEARRRLTGARSGEYPEWRDKALDAAWAMFETSTASEDDDAWANAWIAFTLTKEADTLGRLAREADEKYSYEFEASLGKGSREACLAANAALDRVADASILYDAAIAAWQNNSVEMSDTTAFRVNLAEQDHDCYELEPLNLGPGGSPLEPAMTYRFAGENATYFTARCGPRVSPIMPVLEQERCFSTGEKAFRFFKSWVPRADSEWVNGSADRRAQLERAAETYRKNVTATLETLGWMRGGTPSFTAHSIR